jgi:UDP-glucuronate 4-epimerase
MQRDFTCVEDAVEAVARLVERDPCGYRLFDIGGGHSVGLMKFVHTLEEALGKRARKRFLPMRKGDVTATHADVEELYNATGYRPSTPLQTGVDRFVSWYRDWHLRHEVQSISQHASPDNVAAARL